MLKKVALGISDFKKLIEKNVYFVDKTIFIKDFMEDETEIIVLPRPRRFGKTLNMSMLRYFLDNREDSKHLFEGLEISKDKEFCEKHLNTYPLIYISLKDVKLSSWKETYKEIARLMQLEYERHSNIIESLSDKEKEIYNDLLSFEPKEKNLRTSLLTLCKYLEKHYGKKAIVLMDEYDAPIHKSYIEEYYQDAIGFFQIFYGSLFKDNLHLHKGLMTGILRVSKESMFSGLNNVEVISILSEQYSQYFGFTEEESVKFAETYGVPTEGMKDWYNGYRIGNHKIYNPWSIINYIKNKGKLREYWVNTSSNDLIKKLIKVGSETTKKSVIELINGKELLARVSESISLKDKELEKRENLLSLLLFSGYLTWKDEVRVGDELQYTLVVPNKEVKILLNSMMEEASKQIAGVNVLIKSVVEGKWQIFKEGFEDTVQESFSHYDVTNREAESFYHAFVMGLLVSIKEEYEIKSNREAGIGRYDLSIMKRDRSRGVIFEFKKVRENDTIEETAKKAIKQIEEREYGREFEGVEVKNIGIAFKGKKALVLFGN